MLKFRISFSPIVTKFIKQNNKEIESKYKEETKNNIGKTGAEYGNSNREIIKFRKLKQALHETE